MLQCSFAELYIRMLMPDAATIMVELRAGRNAERRGEVKIEIEN